jgi:hypothetical protein
MRDIQRLTTSRRTPLSTPEYLEIRSASRIKPFYPHAVPRHELSDEFLACLTGKLIEEIHHSRNLKHFH